MISQTLSPTWNQCLLMSRLLLSGDLRHIQQEPPRIVIEVYDDDALVVFTPPLCFFPLQVSETDFLFPVSRLLRVRQST